MMSKKAILVTIVLVAFLTIKPYEATRVLNEEEEQWLRRGQYLLQPLLQHRSIPPPGPNPCSWVPSKGRACTTSIGQRNFAGRATAYPPPPPPKQSFEFGVAAKRI